MQFSVVASQNKPLATLPVTIEAAEDHEYKHFTEQQPLNNSKGFYNKQGSNSTSRQKHKVCEHCGRLHGANCWYLDDSKAPEWFKKQRELQSRLLGGDAKKQRTEDMDISIMGAGRDNAASGQHHVVI